MKSKIIILLLITLSACNKNNLINEQSFSEVSIGATVEHNSTKAHIYEGSFNWSESDQISVWTTAGYFQVLSLTDGAGSASAQFKGTLNGENASLATCAIYPAGSHTFDGETVIVHLPSEYDLTNDIASVKMPMFAHLDVENAIVFTHLAGLVSFNLKNVPVGTNQIALEATDKTITGNFPVKITDTRPIIYATSLSKSNRITIKIPPVTEITDISVYIPLPVGVYNGFKLELLNENNEVLSVKETSKSNTIARKTLVNMPNMDMTPKPLNNKDLYARMLKDISDSLKKHAFDSDGNKLLTFAHTSDIHPRGVNYKRNLDECVNFCNANINLLDALLITGDFSNGVQGRLVWWTTEEFECVLPIMDKSVLPLYPLVGNHDDNINLTTGYPAVDTGINPKNAELYHLDKSDQYRWIIGRYLEKFNPQEADPEVCYYKVDFDAYNIRMVFLDAMDCPLIFENGYIKHIPGLFFNQRQLEWFYDTLISTPDDYGVIVVCHGPFIPGFERAKYAQGVDLIPNIINAFKEGSIYEHDWRYSEDASISTSYKFDFSRHGKGDFICYLAGHIHYRKMAQSYFDDQLVITAPALYQADLSEMTRKGSSLDRYRDTTTINSFNIMTVDRENRKILLTSYGAFEDEDANILSRTEEIRY